MAKYSTQKINNYFKRSNASNVAAIKGKEFEELSCYIFSKLPGITINAKNVKNSNHTEEIDIAFWNEKIPHSLDFLPQILLVECKNWSKAVGSIEVSWFKEKLRSRSLDIGFLIATQVKFLSKNILTNRHEIHFQM